MVGKQYRPLNSVDDVQGQGNRFPSLLSPLNSNPEHQAQPYNVRKSPNFELTELREPLTKSSSLHAENGAKSSKKRLNVWQRFTRRYGLTGWRVGVLLCIVVSSLVCILNIALTIWATTNHRVENGISFLYTGSCREAARMSLWVHLGINIMSTLLLSASNYTMQIIGSPTRADIDANHKNYKWLDIGIPSVRNLRRLPGRRRIMWAMLFLSSVPLHLLYNTAVFASLSANSYNYFVVSPSFLTPTAKFNDTGRSDITPNGRTNLNPGYGSRNMIIDILHTKTTNNSLTRLEKEDCINAYSQNFVSKYRNVLLITEDASRITEDPENTVFIYGQWNDKTAVSFHWICGDEYPPNPFTKNGGPVCNLGIAKEHVTDWTVLGYKISYCMVEKVQENCRLRFSLGIMIVVILSNIAKVLAMVWTYWKLKGSPLVTIGDAAASFLTNPDPTTKNMCLTTMEDIRKASRKLKYHTTYQYSQQSGTSTNHEDHNSNISPSTVTNQPVDNTEGWNMSKGSKIWQPKRHFWFKAASIRRWITCNFLCTLTIAITLAFYLEGTRTLGTRNISELWKIGFGTVHPMALAQYQTEIGLIPTILLANLPQAILSFLYLTYNGLFSCLLSGWEWSLFATKRRGLRVTSPTGDQRSTWYLQLPYFYAIPLLILSGTLHWLTSQSIFLASILVHNNPSKYTSQPTPPTYQISKIGYSPIAILCAMLVGSVSIVIGVANGFQRYDDKIPVVGSCSAAISAACHGVDGEGGDNGEGEKMAEREVMWGVVSEGDGDEDESVGHCALSADDVGKLVTGRRYAGWVKGDD